MPADIVPCTAVGTYEDHAVDFPYGPGGVAPASIGADKRDMKPESILAVRAGMELVFNRQTGYFLEIRHRVLLLMD
jgi:hypothetical protein